MSEQLAALKQRGPGVLSAYLRNVRLELLGKAGKVFRTAGASAASTDGGAA